MQCPSTQFEVTPFPSVQDKAFLEKAPSGKATTMTPCSKAQFYWKLLAEYMNTPEGQICPALSCRWHLLPLTLSC